MKTNLTKTTIFNYFSGLATPLQKKMIEDWLSVGTNYEVYYEWLEEWEREHPQFLPDVDQVLQGFMQKNTTTVYYSIANQQQKKRSTNYSVWAYAAAVAALLMITTLFGWDHVRYEHYTTGYAEVKSLELEDGSTVTLNANSVLKVPRFDFDTEARKVYLKGEAEFSVVHTKDDRKFLVLTPDHLEVEVLGTEFIVFSRSRGSKVVLNKGKVSLRTLNDTTQKPITIKPGDVVTIHNGIFNVKEKQEVETHLAWKDHRFVFDHTPLIEIADQVQENFGLQMHISDRTLARRELTGTYEAENADELMEVLSRILDLEITKDGNDVILTKR